MEVVRATSSDVDELVRMRLAYVAEDCGGITPEQRQALALSLPAYFAEHVGHDLRAYVAREDDSVVGCCLLVIKEQPPNLAFMNGLIGTVLNVYVEPAYRRRGLARQLMELLLSDARSLGVDRLELKATPAGEKLYRNLGFCEPSAAYTALELELSR